MCAIDRFRICQAEVLRLEATNDHTWDAVEVAGRAWNKAAAALCSLAPTTAAGLAARASAVVMVLSVCVGDCARPERFEETAETHERLAMAFAEDVMRLAGGAA